MFRIDPNFFRRCTRPTHSTHIRHHSDSTAHRAQENRSAHRHKYAPSMDSAPSTDSGSIPSAPSPIEVSFYYHGLPSNPNLVARTGSKKWDKTPQGLWGYRKFLAPVGDHAIVQHWKEGQDLPESIIKTLIFFPWAGIDILRVGEWNTMGRAPPVETLPVVMLITVKAGSTQWETAHFFASDCKARLVEFGITDIEVEVKESTHNSLVSPSSDDIPDLGDSNDSSCLYSGDPSVFQCPQEDGAVHGKLVEPLRHLADTIGTRLSPDAYTGMAGTKGLYLRVAPTDPEIWPFKSCIAVLTCRHVVFRGRHDRGEVYRWDGQLSTRLFVSQDTGTDDIMGKARKILDDAKHSLDELEWFSFKYGPGEKEHHRKQLEFRADRTSRQANVAKLVEPILDQTRQQDMSIRVGHVLFAQKLSTMFSTTSSSSSRPLLESYSTGCWLRDYALVQMSDSVHTRDPTNRLPISCRDLENKLTSIFSTLFPVEFNQRSTDKNAVLSSQIIPDSEIMNFKENQWIVGKFGMCGLTFGEVNEVKSITRCPEFNGAIQSIPAWEICVINPVSQSTNPQSQSWSQPAFSRPSDSGSAVWDMEGRVVGIMTGGPSTDLYGGTDTTYVTGIERIIQDLEASGVTATLL